ncbi:longitudinals lacking protein-like [Calliopsis andreniformis]|uniref:longitudinals lacking protein-like n=1 Tax=Calliopsis andreniformis TaxID=337506 RepID=UPI003FCCB2F3
MLRNRPCAQCIFGNYTTIAFCRQPNGDGWFQCPRCTRSFLSNDCMTRHYRNHCDVYETRFWCTYCDYGSKYSSNVYKHVRRVHKQMPFFKPHRLFMNP